MIRSMAKEIPTMQQNIGARIWTLITNSADEYYYWIGTVKDLHEKNMPRSRFTRRDSVIKDLTIEIRSRYALEKNYGRNSCDPLCTQRESVSIHIHQIAAKEVSFVWAASQLITAFEDRNNLPMSKRL